MVMVGYDGTFEGLLSAVFEIYEYKLSEPSIVQSLNLNGSLFGQTHEVITNRDKCNRVYKKLKDKLTPNGLSQLYKTFLSEQKDIENVIFRYIAYTLASKASVENNFSNADVLLVQQTSRKVHREKHRMEAFVRFQ
ncbi:MAG: DUF4130 domain-containing protein, partial [Sphingobacteriales bacterium]